MNLVVNGGFGDGACGKEESGQDQDPNQWFSRGQGKKGTKREHLLLKSWQVQSL